MRTHLPILATLLVFAWLVVDRALFRPPEQIADAYHAQVRAAAEALPRHHGDWLGVDVPVPTGAIKLLNANTIVSRRFQNMRTGETVIFLFVHVRDARDILGHYPPGCYPGQGWHLEGAEPVEWESAEARVHGTQYRFRRESLEGGSRLAVDNFLLLPDGTICRDMEEVESAAMDRLRKVFGAAQVQLVYDASIPPHRRYELTSEFIEFAAPAIRAIGSIRPEEKHAQSHLTE